MALCTRHCRAGLQVVPSLRDSPHGPMYPALPCRATGCAVPTGLAPWPYVPGSAVPGYRLCRPYGTRPMALCTRQCRAGLQVVPSLRDSPRIHLQVPDPSTTRVFKRLVNSIC
jgi:hypothetical protein